MRRDALNGLDMVGGALLVPAIGGLTYAISVIPTKGASPETFGLLGGSLALLALWVRHELRHPNPLIDLRLLGIPRIAISNLIIAFTGLSIFQSPYLITVLAQQPAWTLVGLGLTATMAGLLRLPSNVAGLVGGAASGVIAPRYGAGVSALLGALGLAAGWGWLALMHDTIPQIVISVVIAGAGTTLLYAGISTILVEEAPAGRTSEANGLMNVIRGCCTAIGSQLVGLSLATSTVTAPEGGRPYASEDAFTFTFGWIIVCCVVCVLLSLLLLRRTRVQPATIEASA